ncbi:hypothetical protein DFH06DRAFT_1229676 [Mycena polygramma]|nr:hypothetical protein DFH06DRAFT_1229676 [Mycena polygramma]
MSSDQKILTATLLARVKNLKFSLKEPRVAKAMWDKMNTASDLERGEFLRSAKIYISEAYLEYMRGWDIIAPGLYESIERAVFTTAIYKQLLLRGKLRPDPRTSPDAYADAFHFLAYAVYQCFGQLAFWRWFSSTFGPLIEDSEAFLRLYGYLHDYLSTNDSNN